jgi:hypothetical protein
MISAVEMSAPKNADRLARCVQPMLKKMRSREWGKTMAGKANTDAKPAPTRETIRSAVIASRALFRFFDVYFRMSERGRAVVGLLDNVSLAASSPRHPH